MCWRKHIGDVITRIERRLPAVLGLKMLHLSKTDATANFTKFTKNVVLRRTGGFYEAAAIGGDGARKKNFIADYRKFVSCNQSGPEAAAGAIHQDFNNIQNNCVRIRLPGKRCYRNQILFFSRAGTGRFKTIDFNSLS